MSTSRLEEEQNVGGGGAAVAKQLEKRRRLEEEALQKVETRLQWPILHLLSFKVTCFLTLPSASTSAVHRMKSTQSGLLRPPFHCSRATIWQVGNELLDEQSDRLNLIVPPWFW